jgi:hypothetical protein
VLTLLIIPTVYEIFDEWREWLFSKFGSATKRAHGVTTAQPARLGGHADK